LFEWEGYRSMARLSADPEALADYRAEARALAEGAVAVDEDPYDWGSDADTHPSHRTG
jgi:hypothetical protein